MTLNLEDLEREIAAAAGRDAARHEAETAARTDQLNNIRATLKAHEPQLLAQAKDFLYDSIGEVVAPSLRMSAVHWNYHDFEGTASPLMENWKTAERFGTPEHAPFIVEDVLEALISVEENGRNVGLVIRALFDCQHSLLEPCGQESYPFWRHSLDGLGSCNSRPGRTRYRLQFLTLRTDTPGRGGRSYWASHSYPGAFGGSANRIHLLQVIADTEAARVKQEAAAAKRGWWRRRAV